MKEELEEILSFSDSTPSHLQHKIIAPRIIETYKQLGLGKSSTDDYFILLNVYARSPFRDFESYLRFVAGLEEYVIQLMLKQYTSNFFTFEIVPGIYTNKDISEAAYTMGDHERTLPIKYDNVSMKTKLILKRFGGALGTIRFDQKSFSTLY